MAVAGPADVDVAVIGAGPAGLAAGLAMAELGFSTAVIGPASDPRDGRSAALFQASITFLKRLGAWDGVAPVSAPLEAIRLIDATGALFRAPEVTFRASEIGEVAFGYNVPNAALTAGLEALSIRRLRRVQSAAVTSIVPNSENVVLTTAEGATMSCRLAVAADGRQSVGRAAAGILTKHWSYEQAAIVSTFSHSRPHNGVSTEFHRRCGPLTVVPGPSNQSNLVWVDTPNEAGRLAALDDAAFTKALSEHLQGLLGTIRIEMPRRMFPLSGQTADPLAQNRIALIGEAGHVMPPIGAQGLNLSFRDAATLADVAAAARDAGEDVGGDAALRSYSDARRFDVTSRVWTIDLLNRSLLSGFTPVHTARGLGLFALKTLAPLRKHLMREGIAPAHALPRLMQSEP